MIDHNRHEPHPEKDDLTGEPIIAGHDYDGIQELDNPLPSWWTASFYIAILFAILYFGYYQLGTGPSIIESFEKDYVQVELAKVAARAKIKFPTDAEMLKMAEDPVWLKNGRAQYAARCVSCHNPQGQGGIGPNLTDKFWIHGGKISQVTKTIFNGVPDKGMPSWGFVLNPDDVFALAIYVKSIVGSNPANPKAPQGEPETQ